MSLRFLTLQLWSIFAIRGPSVGTVLMAQAVHQMYALELDVEPPASMPAAERADRLNLFHSLVIMDWFSAGTIKRSYYIREEPLKHPYMFSQKRLPDRLETLEPPLTPHQWLKLELARLNRRGADRSGMSETDAYNTTIEIQREFDDLYMSLPPEYDAELTREREVLDSASFHRLGIMVAMSTQLISLHKRYYIQGWLDPAYRTSRDICFTSARRICSLFRKVFSYNISVQEIMTMEISEVQAVLEKRQKLTSRLWFMAHASVGASLLLQHHYALMEAHPSAVGPNPDKVRIEIVEDLRVTKRLLQALSSRSQIAKSGVEVLTKPDTASQCFGDTNNKKESPREEVDEVTRKRRANLAMDLQSITDIDTFSPRRVKRRSGHDYISSGASSSQSNFKTSMGPPSQHASPLNAQPKTYSTPSPSVSTSNNTNNNGGSSANVRMEMAEMEALLQSALSTDLYTGLPLAPEVSFQRQADRIGGTQPYLPSGLLGTLSPYSNNFFGFESFGGSAGGNMPGGGLAASSIGNAVLQQQQQQHQQVLEPSNGSWF
jgi:hypothetical protein